MTEQRYDTDLVIAEDERESGPIQIELNEDALRELAAMGAFPIASSAVKAWTPPRQTHWPDWSRIGFVK